MNTMADQPDREELVALVQRIMVSDGTDDEIDEMIATLERSVPHPAVIDLMFHDERELTAEQVVDIALAYKPIQLD